MPPDMGTVNSEVQGTAIYAPVEMMLHGQTSSTADIYALALLIGEALNGQTMYDKVTMAQAVFAVVNMGLRPQMPSWTPEKLVQLLQRSWSNDRAERPSIQEFLHHLREVMDDLA
jgi:hypothetical protein